MLSTRGKQYTSNKVGNPTDKNETSFKGGTLGYKEVVLIYS